jgi:hypothetical protein
VLQYAGVGGEQEDIYFVLFKLHTGYGYFDRISRILKGIGSWPVLYTL